MLDYTTVETLALSLFSDANAPTSIGGEGKFAAKVRSASIILKANNPISYDDIRRVTPGVYYQIALRIAAAKFPNISAVTKNADGSETFQDNTKNIDFQWLQEDIVAMLDPKGNSSGDARTDSRLGSFSGGLEWAASKLVAAHLIRNIPLNNSSLKFVDVADNLEEQALEDVDRIIRIESGSSGGSASSGSSSASSKGQATFCIAHSIDTSSISLAAYDVPDTPPSPTPPGYVPTYTGTVNIGSAEVVNTLSVEPGEVGICYFYMTGQAYTADQDLITSRIYGTADGNPQNSASVSYKIEKAFLLVDGDNPETYTIDDLITNLADEINAETLNTLPTHVANILTAPERGKAETTPELITKRELDPLTTTNKNRRGLLNLYRRINKLSFDVRRYSNKATTELLTIGFYTISKADWDSYNNVITPLTAKELKALGTIGVNGLVFGSSDTYRDLGSKVPYSALLNVEKGNVASVSIDSGNGGSSSESPDSVNDSEASNVIDTFYFSYDPNDNPFIPQPFSSDLILRVTTTSYLQSIPLDITVNLTTQPFNNPIIIPIGEQVANRVSDAIYNYTRNTNLNQNTLDNSNVLGVVLGNYEHTTTIVNNTTGTATQIPLEEIVNGVVQTNFTPISHLEEPLPSSSAVKDSKAGRVQIVAFRYRDEEYKIVIEVLSIPSNLWIATGNFILRRTQWVQGRRRAITLDTKVLSSGTAALTQTTAEELNSVQASVGKAEATKSELLQRVYDKRRLLQEAQKGFPTKWHSRI